MKKTLGGDRLGAGKKIQVELHNYERSTHDLGYIWRSTMSSGTLVPFLSEVALPGDTFDINLNCDVLTHPTIGPLFGSYKVQLDVFQAPLRLYQGLLHNNKLGIGLTMSEIMLPAIRMTALEQPSTVQDPDNSQINPSSLLSYVGIRGIGIVPNGTGASKTRDFNAIPILAYWEIYKNYYANKQEEEGAVIHTEIVAVNETVTSIDVYDNNGNLQGQLSQTTPGTQFSLDDGWQIDINYTGAVPDPSTVLFNTTEHGQRAASAIIPTWNDNGTRLNGVFNGMAWPVPTTLESWDYRTGTTPTVNQPNVTRFDLANIDTMRENLLADSTLGAAYLVNTANLEPYKWLYEHVSDIPYILQSQEGLAVKTYQSDMLNNWLQTEWIDGTNGINAITAIDTSSGSFTIDTLNLSKKVYDMLNRIAVSGGSYDDWMDAVWTHDRYTRCESPMYMGGLIKELVFQEVVSNSQSDDQPLGTLAGKGVMGKKHKGGHVVVKVDEPSYIIGIVSLTPRLDYSQGNKWDINLQSLDDLHKPALDEIGFQELITEQMHWADTQWDGARWVQQSAGKQPAWLNYMTNINQTRGNFAIQGNEMFMTLNRRYNLDDSTFRIDDITTYIDPAKFNFIFAETALDAQNFWTQISVDITARRKMSAKVMPNL